MLLPRTGAQRDRDERLRELVKRSASAFNALPVTKQNEILREQTKSWVRANVPVRK
jgi:hypothetical protein